MKNLAQDFPQWLALSKQGYTYRHSRHGEKTQGYGSDCFHRIAVSLHDFAVLLCYKVECLRCQQSLFGARRQVFLTRLMTFCILLSKLLSRRFVEWKRLFWYAKAVTISSTSSTSVAHGSDLLWARISSTISRKASAASTRYAICLDTLWSPTKSSWFAGSHEREAPACLSIS
jgi:hypothetical protein